jgi:hypothetical protein
MRGRCFGSHAGQASPAKHERHHHETLARMSPSGSYTCFRLHSAPLSSLHTALASLSSLHAASWPAADASTLFRISARTRARLYVGWRRAVLDAPLCGRLPALEPSPLPPSGLLSALCARGRGAHVPSSGLQGQARRSAKAVLLRPAAKRDRRWPWCGVARACPSCAGRINRPDACT